MSLPHPFWIDLFKTPENSIEESFIFHYKSGSNWLPFYTPEYNQKKTAEMRKLIG
jgi:hypothetical protein